MKVNIPPMAKHSNKPVKTNPFATYRDPHTGRWVVVKTAA
mgnify:CR=1 FL=1